jgi:hypothetical protein
MVGDCVADHFTVMRNMVGIGSGAQREKMRLGVFALKPVRAVGVVRG